MDIATHNKILDFLKDAQSRPNFMSKAKGLLDPDELFSLERLRQLLANPLLTPDWVQVTIAGKIIDLRPSVVWKVVQDKQLHFMDKEILNQALAKRASVVLEGIDIMEPAIAKLVADIDQTMPCALSNCEAFFSRNGNEAYGGHRDTDDVLVIQISGNKRWRVHEPQQRRYIGNSPLTDGMMGPVAEEFDLEPGDVIFVRAGVPHKCTTVTDHSLHLSFDLIDRTLNIEQITKAANYRYEQGMAEPHVDAVSVVEKYMEYLRSDSFKTELEKTSIERKKEAVAFRKRIVGSSLAPNLNVKK